MICDPPTATYSDCDLDLSTVEADLHVYEHAALLLEAARCVAGAGICGDVYRCPPDAGGGWRTGTPENEHGVVIGRPDRVGECCCGSIAVGTRTVVDPFANAACTDPAATQYDLKITWPCSLSDYAVHIERARFLRLVADVACCKAPAGTKTSKGPNFLIAAVDETSIEDDCPTIVITYTAS